MKNTCIKFLVFGVPFMISSAASASSDVADDGSVTYTGVDAMSFYMAKRTIYPCTPEFYNK